MEKYKLLLFDLDGTLLQSDKTISQRTMQTLHRCREKGILLGISTSRSETNALAFVKEMRPDILIASGGAIVKYKGEYIYKAEFSAVETQQIIADIRKICGAECQITVDTVNSHYWNYTLDPKEQNNWGVSIYTDYSDFNECSLKICAEIFDESQAKQLKERLENYDCVRFSDGYWYKFTQKGVTKENAISEICAACKIRTNEIMAFGDDYADIGMLELCGTGVAMGNAIDEVKEKADIIIGGNDNDGIAEYLEKIFN